MVHLLHGTVLSQHHAVVAQMVLQIIVLYGSGAVKRHIDLIGEYPGHVAVTDHITGIIRDVSLDIAR